MSSEYYVFNNISQANAAINAINTNPVFPIIGVNFLTGLPAPDKQKTEIWAEEPLALADEFNNPNGEYAVPRVSIERMDAYGIPENQRQQFLNAYGQDIRPKAQINILSVE